MCSRRSASLSLSSCRSLVPTFITRICRRGTMRSALYYPHTQIRDEGFLKNALLVWDEVHFISPTRHFEFDRHLDPGHREALELICRPLVPSDEEKRHVHNRILKL